MAKREPGDGWVELTAGGGRGDGSEEVILDAALLLRPRTAPQMLDFAVEVLVTRLPACIGICALIWFPLRAIMPWFVDLMNEDLGPQNAQELWTFALSLIALTGAQTLAAVISTTAVTLIVHAQLVGRPISAIEALRRTLRRLLALVGVFVINVGVLSVGLGLLLVLTLFCPPLLLAVLALYVYVTWKFSVAPSALVLENLGVIQSIRRSWQLTSGSLLRWILIWVLVQLLVVGFGAGLQLGDNPDLRDIFLSTVGIPKTLFNVVFIGISAVFSGIATAFTSAAMTVFYLDTRIRSEGFDLTMRLDRLRGLHDSGLETAP